MKATATPPPPLVDTSMCAHLRALVDRRAPPTPATTIVKTEPDDDHGENTGDGSGDGESRQDAGGYRGMSRSANGSSEHVVDTSPWGLAEKRFTEIVRWGAIGQGVRRRKTAPPKCHGCKKTLPHPWGCLTCDFIGCPPYDASMNTVNVDCLPSHFAQSTRCSFAVNPINGAIFCSECDDTVYPDTFEDLFRRTRIRVEEEHDFSREGSLLGGGRGRGRGHWKPWDGAGGGVGSSGDMVRAPCRGLRPILNLSQTCFLSAILQALIHNPLLKAYFLSEKHNRHVCTNGSRGLAVGRPFLGTDNGSGLPAADREKGCMCCEMDRAFEEFYSGDFSPFGPITMLYTLWHASDELAGHGQQDAHSVFLAVLDQIHAHAKGQLSSCNCIAHQTFAGSLISSVTCSSCKTTNTTVDPILDIQLDFPITPPGLDETLTLAALLRRFCAEEQIGDHQERGYDCGACGGGSGVVATRKFSIKKLPPVLSFQFKRFAHSATSSKVETPVRFPSHLNMRPFVDTDSDADTERDLPSILFEYDLFAVVTHEGKLDNGHYWADVRSGDEWWHCDDDKVTPTTLRAVREQRAYMLFYVKTSLAYGQPMSRLLATNGSIKLNGGGVNGALNGTAPSANGTNGTTSATGSIQA